MNLLIKNANYYINGTFEKGDILCKDGKIVSLLGKGCADNDTTPFNLCSDGQPAETSGEESGNVFENTFRTIDARGNYVVPGFIDVHLHGAVGVDANSADILGYEKISKFLATQGVTSWLASVLTDTKEQTLSCIDAVKIASSKKNKGAFLLGLHLEGPFLAKDYKGAMPEHLLKKGDTKLLEQYITAADGAVKYVTVAPEVDGVIDMIEALSNKTVFALGHSAAEYYTAMKAYEKGARCTTHTFNAMRLFHQHEPAIMGAALASDCYCEAICDGLHLHPGSLEMLLKCKGYDKVIAVSDSIMAAGLSDGEYMLGVNEITVKNGDAKLKNSDVRAGSTITAINSLKNVLKFTGCNLSKALPLFTQNPANALKLSSKGYIDIGFDADFTILDKDINVIHTIVGANIVFSK